MRTILNGECHGKEEFFNRFSASEQERQTYVPLLLTIEYSYGGELAETKGVFLNSRNKCLYQVRGTECSVWDFDGQFDPELITFDEFEKVMGEFKASKEEKDNLLKDLNNVGLNKEAINVITGSYSSYLYSHDITSEHEEKIGSVSRIEFEQLFAKNLVKVEEKLSYYEFNTDYGYAQTFFVDFNLKGKMRISSALDKSMSSFDDVFVSDLMGCLEIKENIFNPPTINTMNRPKMR